MMRRPVALSDEERIDWLRLARTEHVGPITFHQLLHRFGSAAEALAEIPKLAERGGRRQPLVPCSKETALRELEAIQACGGRLIAGCEEEYSSVLATLDDAPPLLSIKGQSHLMHRRGLAIVGARNASLNGVRFAERLAQELSAAGLVIISGLARGIDGAAHKGSLKHGTIAVVAGGLDIYYPPEHHALQDEIAENGLVIAELPPGTRPQARHFPRRNRLVSGLSMGVLVVEAALRSGSLITARFALEQGRDVMAVPGSPLDPRCRGTNNLLREGAILVETAGDVLAALEHAAPPQITEEKDWLFDKFDMGYANTAEHQAVKEQIITLLSPTPIMVDELRRECQTSPALLALVLLELELAGRLERFPGNRVALVALPAPHAGILLES